MTFNKSMLYFCFYIRIIYIAILWYAINWRNMLRGVLCAVPLKLSINKVCKFITLNDLSTYTIKEEKMWASTVSLSKRGLHFFFFIKIYILQVSNVYASNSQCNKLTQKNARACFLAFVCTRPTQPKITKCSHTHTHIQRHNFFP